MNKEQYNTVHCQLIVHLLVHCTKKKLTYIFLNRNLKILRSFLSIFFWNHHYSASCPNLL